MKALLPSLMIAGFMTACMADKSEYNLQPHANAATDQATSAQDTTVGGFRLDGSGSGSSSDPVQDINTISYPYETVWTKQALGISSRYEFGTFESKHHRQPDITVTAGAAALQAAADAKTAFASLRRVLRKSCRGQGGGEGVLTRHGFQRIQQNIVGETVTNSIEQDLECIQPKDAYMVYQSFCASLTGYQFSRHVQVPVDPISSTGYLPSISNSAQFQFSLGFTEWPELAPTITNANNVIKQRSALGARCALEGHAFFYLDHYFTSTGMALAPDNIDGTGQWWYNRTGSGLFYACCTQQPPEV